MPCAASSRIQGQKPLVTGTSLKGGVVQGAGVKAAPNLALSRNTAISWRVTLLPGQ